MSVKRLTYKSAGVDVNAGYETVNLIKSHVKSTFTKGVVSDIGGFGGLFALDKDNYKEPVLVSGTDGVGTKLKIAFMADKHDTIGIDCVAMSVNDILCQGAKPLFFLDYLAVGNLDPYKASKIVEGVATGCRESECALIGGETAEMPGLYSEGEYDLAGFAVGIVDRQRIIDGSSIKAGDLIIGLPSSGLHSNGFSLVRKLFFEVNDYKIDSYIPEFKSTLGEELLKPTKIYASVLMKLMENCNIKGISHITGGGFYENIPRTLPQNLDALIDLKEIKTPPIFNYIKDLGNIDIKEMYSTFNMGVGIVMVVDKEEAIKVTDILREMKEDFFLMGEIVDGEGEVKICL